MLNETLIVLGNILLIIFLILMMFSEKKTNKLFGKHSKTIIISGAGMGLFLIIVAYITIAFGG